MSYSRRDVQERFEPHLVYRPLASRTITMGSIRRTLATTSPTSLKSVHLPRLDFARKSSISRVPILYPIFSSCLLTSP